MDVRQDHFDRPTARPHRWFTALAGGLPFLYFGPLAVLLNYAYPAWRASLAFREVVLALNLLFVAAGFSVGWLKRFPLWSYPYLCMGVCFLYFGVQIQVSRKMDSPVGIPLLAGALLFGLLLYVTRRDSPLKDLARDVGRDWTRLSLGLLILPTLLFTVMDPEKDLLGTLVFVVGPSLALLLAAALALMAKNKPTRLVILAAGMLLMLVLRMLSGKWGFVFYWLFAVLVVFSPYMVELWARSSQANPETGSQS